ncbi:MAG: hypothetical protein KKC29_14050 [Alphaproteobacteria bacterium]|jgi:hypothetical protein|nr:hypothetical protein [Alphaproteobacteria bacterium]MBU2040697.1 hypothetical protein [Alphaproteobacteria bacterium]MBU2126615.1 hypothetical protein [Alphaproteobacteria bacterium]MBU2208605.1 hypothetical protein [Alphaproteobacteria bacterium]MBU2292213.1 hypothetical protein [Alphaproteobacteria bacterium]
MIALFIAAALAAQSPPAPVWTWTLYADAEPVVLAHEVPDTANLRTTLECDPGASVAHLTLYGGAAMTGMARITAGDASAVAEAASPRSGATRLALRIDHPVFAAFTVDGQVVVIVGDQRRAIEVPAAHLAKLRRFAELCSG